MCRTDHATQRPNGSYLPCKRLGAALFLMLRMRKPWWVQAPPGTAADDRVPAATSKADEAEPPQLLVTVGIPPW